LFGDVANDLRRRNNGARGIMNGRNRQRHVYSASVLGKPHGLKVIDAFATPNTSEDIVLFGQALRRDQNADRLSNEFSCRVPE
jgi:hypothetical protein